MQGPVNAIVGWGGAQADRPALVDEYLIILTASCQVERAALGTIVSERLRAGGLSDSERNALLAARGRSDTDIGARECIDERFAILLAWLHHAAALWRKRATQPAHHIWLATNVTPVLEAVAAWPPSSMFHAGRLRRRQRCTDELRRRPSRKPDCHPWFAGCRTVTRSPRRRRCWGF
jgi:hypothetical protein